MIRVIIISSYTLNLQKMYSGLEAPRQRFFQLGKEFFYFILLLLNWFWFQVKPTQFAILI